MHQVYIFHNEQSNLNTESRIRGLTQLNMNHTSLYFCMIYNLKYSNIFQINYFKSTSSNITNRPNNNSDCIQYIKPISL